MAGLLGAILVLPQSIAFAALAGLPAQYGIYTAIVPCAIAALFGSSRHVVSGPTNAISLALFAMLSPIALAGSPEYLTLALAITLMVGAMQLSIGILRLGAIADFISPSVLLGFTAGAATLIALYALKDLFALPVPGGTSAIGVIQYLHSHAGDLEPWAPAVGAVTLI
ncbi:MAG: SulP family inorganic anion transporter, partial [Terriglobales bacterium]